VKGLPGYYEKPGKVWRTGVGYVDGYKWGVKFKPNENGKMTRTAAAIGEGMRPFNRAEIHRQAEMAMERGVMPYQAPMRPGGAPTAEGPSGMLFVRVGDEWLATGRWCSTTPHEWSKPPKGGLKDGTMDPRYCHFDPDGDEWWEFVNDGWERAAGARMPDGPPAARQGRSLQCSE
jgi:hypothetical protein